MKTAYVIALVAFALALTAVSARRDSLYTRWHQLEAKNYDFTQYVREYGKVYEDHEVEMRREIFEANLQKVLEHNRRPGASWKMGINHLSDHTESELKQMRGHRKHLNQMTETVARRSDLAVPHKLMKTQRPDSVDWRQKGAITPVKDQGRCGSCWTFAAAETVESFHFLATGSLMELSEQQIASCTPNSEDCGGTGGCEGGTAEVAFQGIITAGGLASEWTYSYNSWNGSDLACKLNDSSFNFRPVVQLSSYTQLPVNDQEALLDAVATLGPIAISVDASAWSAYESGVFAGCNMTAPDIDHAVQLVGYGTDPEHGDYWIVRNSWTPTWGEHGFVRIARPSTVPCGVDPNPGDGTACKPYPASINVCGMCGILSDSAYPHIKLN